MPSKPSMITKITKKISNNLLTLVICKPHFPGKKLYSRNGYIGANFLVWSKCDVLVFQ